MGKVSLMFFTEQDLWCICLYFGGLLDQLITWEAEIFWRKIIGFSSPKIGSNLPKLEGNREFTSQNYDFANHNIYGFNQAEQICLKISYLPPIPQDSTGLENYPGTMGVKLRVEKNMKIHYLLVMKID